MNVSCIFLYFYGGCAARAALVLQKLGLVGGQYNDGARSVIPSTSVASADNPPKNPLIPPPPPRLCLSFSPQDLEGIVDTYSDDEGDKTAQDNFINDEAAAGDRQALKDMVRRVREGFGDERGGGRGRGGNARGNLRLDELTRADKSTRGEARRLGLLNRWVTQTGVVGECRCRW